MKGGFNMNLMDYLNSAKRSLFRWGSLQFYVESENFEEDMRFWRSFLAKKKAEGVLLERVRLVTLPLTEYTKTELEVHRESKKYGDNIKIIKSEDFDKLNINEKDFWLIDDEIVLVMNYDQDGKYLGFDVLKNDTQNFVSLKKILLENSVEL